VDGVLLVVRQYFTTRQAALLAKQLLQQVNARIIGSILNMATTSRSGYGTYYGYQKHYSNYYSNDSKRVDS
jgi:Mrp family chromosome partitioning ATPase